MTIDLHVRADGPPDAPAVVFLHSLGANGTMWEPQLGRFAGRYRVFRPDLRGHGRSPVPAGPYSIAELADDVAAMLDRFAIAAAHVVGVSLGAMVAMRLAVAHPSRIDRLVLCCTSAKLGPPEQWAARAETARTDGVGALAPTVASRWLTPGYAAAHPEALQALTTMIAQTPAEGYAGACAAVGAMDQVADLARITAATLVIAGAEDPAAPPAHGELIAATIPGARFTIVPGVAHLATYERPDLLDPLIEKALTDG